MQIDDNTVNRLAELARLKFDEESRKSIIKDLNNILTHIEKLQEINTDNVEPLIYMTEETNVVREDHVEMEITREDALKNAPKKDSDYFKVPRVLDKQ